MTRYNLLFSVDEEDKEIILHLGNGVTIAFPSFAEYDNFIEQMQDMRAEISNHLEWS
jgi:hypothetical protein